MILYEYMVVKGCEYVFNVEKRWIRRIQKDEHEESANKLIQKRDARRPGNFGVGQITYAVR